MFALWPATAEFVCLASVHFAYWLAWGGTLALSVALVFVMRTRWGHSRPLQKCAALSLLVHLILVFLTMTVRIVVGDGSGGGGSLGGTIHVRIVQDVGLAKSVAASVTEVANDVPAPALLEPPPQKEEAPKPSAVVETPPVKSESAPPVDKKPVIEPTKAIVETHAADHAPQIAAASPAGKPAEALKSPTPSTTSNSNKQQPAVDPATAVNTAPKKAPTQSTAPAATPTSPAASDAYSLRNASDRLSLIEGQGGNAKTEAAVVAALNWLVNAQSSDGRWNANQFGAGQGRKWCWDKIAVGQGGMRIQEFRH